MLSHAILTVWIIFTLFNKLLAKGMPIYVIRIISFWHQHKNMSVKLGKCDLHYFYCHLVECKNYLIFVKNMFNIKKGLTSLFKPTELKDIKSMPMQVCWLENLVFVLMMSRCAYLKHIVLTCTVHNSGMILLKSLWTKETICWLY